MKRVKIFILITLALTFVAFVPKIESQIMPPLIPFPPPSLHPLCLSQLALVSYACAMLPPTTTLPPSPLTPPPSPSSPGDDEGHGNDQSQGHHQTSQEENCCRGTHDMCDKWYGMKEKSGDSCDLKDTEIQDARQLYGRDMIGEEALFNGIYSRVCTILRS
ncbi:hypothetical protein JHK84_026961 [Glycine max]|nr:hypothetical protein JHK85_027347 [Glycine max]KAG5002714.1 hypothetical protein JHK86_026853 [Glycine max]KAG5150489.1 hypothetical protein JHK84_026961 [Glycine max]